MQSETSKKSLLDETFIKICKKLKNFDKELNDKFCMLNTNFDRFRFIWSLGFFHAELDSIFDRSKLEASAKNTTKAFEHRKLGNEFYVAKKFDEALINYNESIRYAPRVHDTEHENDLALSYGNRSAVFFHIDEYRLCVSDIDRALKFGYPKHLRHKLIERKLNCFLRLEWFNEALNLLKVEGDANFQNTLKEKIKEAKELLDSCIEPHAIDRLHFGSYGKIPFSLSSTNPKMPNASSQLSIDYSFDRGFHLSASTDIQAGDLIVTERPFASILLPAYFKTHCYECLLSVDTRKMSLAFCRQCTNVTYCSPECERKSWSKSGHQHECAYISLLSAPETGLGHMEWLALRIVLRAGWIYLAERRVDLEAYEFAYERRLGRNEAALFGADPFDELKIYKSDDYLRVFSLMTNSYVRKLNDLFRRSFVAMFLVKLLTRGEFFDSDSSDKASCFVGGLILRHLQSISCNAHEISELQFDANATKRPLASSTAQGIGAGIYAILSLFNHSCDPHVARTFRGLECQVRALRHCKRGDEVLDNYGVIYAVNDITERQERLVEQYFFECRCVACDNKWPLYDALRPVTIDKTNVKCLACRSGKPKSDCIDCVSEIDNLKLVQFNAETSLKNMLALPKDVDLENEEVMRRLEAGFGNFCFYIRALENFKIPRPIQDYNNNEEAIKQCLNLINLKYNPY